MLTKDDFKQALLDVYEMCNNVLTGNSKHAFAVDLAEDVLTRIRGDK